MNYDEALRQAKLKILQECMCGKPPYVVSWDCSEIEQLAIKELEEAKAVWASDDCVEREVLLFSLDRTKEVWQELSNETPRSESTTEEEASEPKLKKEDRIGLDMLQRFEQGREDGEWKTIKEFAQHMKVDRSTASRYLKAGRKAMES